MNLRTNKKCSNLLLIAKRFLVVVLRLVFTCIIFFATSSYAKYSKLNDNDGDRITDLGVLNALSENYIDINTKISESIVEYADQLDTAVTPHLLQNKFITVNRSKVFVKLGSDITALDSTRSFYDFGLQLHLPKLENYWKVKFTNSDDKKDRGYSSIKRLGSKATPESQQKLFLGLLFLKNWSSVDVQYEPRISTVESLGIDHSFEFRTKFTAGVVNIKPAFEVFSDHNEGGGYSAYLNNEYEVSKTFKISQLNDGRYVSLSRALRVNHSVVFSAMFEDDWSASLSLHQAYDNFQSYGLESRGQSLTLRNKVLKEKLIVEFTPYLSYSRSLDFQQIAGLVLAVQFTF